MITRRIAHLARTQIDQWRSPEALERRSARRLAELLSHVFVHNDFYHSLWWEAGVRDPRELREPGALQRLPVVTKAQLKAAWPDTLLSRDRQLSEGRMHGSSGSSGRPFEVFVPDDAFDAFLAYQYRVFSMVGCRPWDRIVYLHGQPEDTGSYLGLFEAVHVCSALPTPELADAIIAARPDVLSSYVSRAMDLARHLGPNSPLRPKVISLNSEQSSAAERAWLSEVFGCPVHDDYGAEEVWMIASSCSVGGLHVHADNVKLELLRADGSACGAGETGSVVVTSLHNRAMPFVRYELGDEAAASDERCPCGRGLPLLASLEGRQNDAFQLPDGARLSAGLLLGLVYAGDISTEIEDFRIVQDAPDHATVLFVTGDETAARPTLEALGRRLSEASDGQLAVDLRRVSSLSRAPGTKRSFACRRFGDDAVTAH